MRYFANFNANNGTHFADDITDTNKNRIIETINGIANGNRFEGNECSWIVRNELGECVAAGKTLSNGQRIRFHGRDLNAFDL